MLENPHDMLSIVLCIIVLYRPVYSRRRSESTGINPRFITGVRHIGLIRMYINVSMAWVSIRMSARCLGFNPFYEYGSYFQKNMLNPFLGALELLRRGMWSVFRLEVCTAAGPKAWVYGQACAAVNLGWRKHHEHETMSLSTAWLAADCWAKARPARACHFPAYPSNSSLSSSAASGLVNVCAIPPPKD
jgi:hypothetical protein